MEQHTFKNVNNCLNINIYSYLKASGGQSSNSYLNTVHFLILELNRNLWQLKTAVFLHWCLICAVPLQSLNNNLQKGAAPCKNVELKWSKFDADLYVFDVGCTPVAQWQNIELITLRLRV